MIEPPAPTQTRPVWTREDLERNPHSAADKAHRVERMFASIARRYDINNRLHSFGRDQFWRRRTVQLAQVQPEDSVLDAACGTGDLSLLFAQTSAARVTGLDLTQEMLEVAREKARRARSGASLEFTRGDVTNLPFDDESFDIVSIAFGLRNVDRPDRALAEMRRVLRAKTGRLLILEFSRPKNRVVRAINSLYCGRIMPFTASIIAGDRSGAYRYLPKSIDAFPDGEALAQMVREAGFASTTTHPLTFGVCTITIGRVR